jgi:hypothetical protein
VFAVDWTHSSSIKQYVGARCGHDAADEDMLGFYALVDEFF